MRRKLSHNDDPTVVDAFQQNDFVREVCHVISDCDPPKGIGINGYWGTGKTSALTQIHYHLSRTCPDGAKPSGAPDPLCHDPKIVPVWFEAWRYQHEALPIVALLNEIRAQMGLWQKLRDQAGKLGGVSLLGSLSAFDEVIKAASGGIVRPQLGKIRDIGTAWEAERHQSALPGQAIRNLLEQAIDEALKKARDKSKKRLVIFIDDLDRCEPLAALRLLEGIKVYLNLRNCVVVFGMDQRQIERALIEALNLAADDGQQSAVPSDHQAREYLEKICQDIFHLPIPDREKKADYLCGLLERLNPGPKGTGQIQGLKDLLAVYDCLPANPRKIKALANRVASVLRRLDVTVGKETFAVSQADKQLNRGCAILLSVAIIYCFHRRVYEQMEKQPGYFQEVLTFATSSSAQDLPNDPRFSPMQGIVSSRDASGGDLPVNPSDSNVFRLHQLMQDLQAASVLPKDVEPFLGK